MIDALNRDMPYDEFLRRQIAGDVLAPDDPEHVVATGFLAAGPWDFVGQVETKSDVLRRQARAEALARLRQASATAARRFGAHSSPSLARIWAWRPSPRASARLENSFGTRW